jgi:hypothetical protein
VRICMLSYYTLGNFCVCVCLCVCLSLCLSVCVCPAIRFHISKRIFSKYGENILWVMTRIVGYFFSAHKARACACVLNERACVHSLIFERIISKFAGNILLLTISVRALRVVIQSIIFGRILFKFAGHILHMTKSYMGYILIMFTHHVHASCLRTRA